jgi:hypothetical protein
MEGKQMKKKKNIFNRFLKFSTRGNYAIPRENTESNKPVINAFIKD